MECGWIPKAATMIVRCASDGEERWQGLGDEEMAEEEESTRRERRRKASKVFFF